MSDRNTRRRQRRQRARQINKAMRSKRARAGLSVDIETRDETGRSMMVIMHHNPASEQMRAYLAQCVERGMRLGATHNLTPAEVGTVVHGYILDDEYLRPLRLPDAMLDIEGVRHFVDWKTGRDKP